MKWTVRFLPEALEDLIETQRWYARREPGLGQGSSASPLHLPKQLPFADQPAPRSCSQHPRGLSNGRGGLLQASTT